MQTLVNPIARRGGYRDDGVDCAIAAVERRFPFRGYMRPERGAYHNIARTILRHLSPGDRILDAGAGPADITAVLQCLGFRCSAFDDLSDRWHGLEGNREKLLEFARETGIDYRVAPADAIPFPGESFDLVMSNDVLEHLHDSPKDLLNDLLGLVRPGGFLLLNVPNAVNLRKRIDVLLGRTNLPPFESYYWHPAPWRGHVREYVRGDMEKLAVLLDLEVIELDGRSHMLTQLPRPLRRAWSVVTSVFRGWRDTWTLLARKRPGWTPRRTIPSAELWAAMGTAMPLPYSEDVGREL